jgi:transposase
VAPLAARLPALEDRLALLAHLAAERRLGAPPCRLARPGAPARGTRADAECGHRRQSIRQDHGKGGPAGTHGYDGGKKVSGRKRHLLVDTGGLVLKAVVHAANITDRQGGQQLLEAIDDVATTFPRLCYLWVDSAYQGSFKDWVEQTLHWTVDVVKRPSRWVWVKEDQEPPPAPTGFQVVRRRWVVERTQSQYLQSALDAQSGNSHDRARWAAEPAHSGHPAARSAAGLCVCSTGSWCAMSIISSRPEHRASAPPRPRERPGAVAGTTCRQPIGNGSCICLVASSNGS